jgi:hypothetical protein
MKYIKSDSYNEYKDLQISTNKRKLDKVWITNNEIHSIVNYIHDNNISVIDGICHGARNGYEVNMFRELLKCNIIGTDISDTAVNFPYMIQWDMHDRNEEWINKFDFIYSNSIDHAYDFVKCLTAWMESLRSNGICCIQWSSEISKPYNKADCFGIDKQDLIDLINRNGYTVVDIIPTNGHADDTNVIIIQHTV